MVADDTSDDGTSDVLVLSLTGRAAVEVLVYHPVVVVILFVVLRENVGLAKIVELLSGVKVGDAVRDGLVKVVRLAMNASLKALVSLSCALVVENLPSPLLAGVVTLPLLLPSKDGYTDRDKLVFAVVAGEVYGGEVFCFVRVADEILEIET